MEILQQEGLTYDRMEMNTATRRLDNISHAEKLILQQEGLQLL